MSKVFALVDCNNFFVSCEKLFRPDLHDKPIVVLSNNDGCVISRSQEAKILGVEMAEPFFSIKRFKNLNIFSANFAFYGLISCRIMKLLKQFSTNVEPYSIDEAFLELSDLNIVDYNKYGKTVIDTILKEIGIPVSIGIGPTKSLAKIAANLAKNSNNCLIIDQENRSDIIKDISVADIWGIGHKSANKLITMGIKTVEDFLKTPDMFIKQELTINGLRIKNELKGVSCIDLDTQHTKKHILSSRSFGRYINDKKVIYEAVSTYVAQAARKLRKQGSVARFITIYLKKKEGSINRNKNISTFLDYYTNETSVFIRTVKKLVDNIYEQNTFYKKAGVILGNIIPNSEYQLTFANITDPNSNTSISNIMDNINLKYGKNILYYTSEGIHKNWTMKSGQKSKNVMTSWKEIPVVK